MSKYHFHPETGDPGICKAEIACPFSIPLNSHYGSMREAAYAAEEAMKAKHQPELIKGFEEWKNAGESLTSETPFKAVEPLEAYRKIMPVGAEILGDYARHYDLTLDEAQSLANVYSTNLKTLNQTTARAMLGEALGNRVKEALEASNSLETQISTNPYFKDFTVKQIPNKDINIVEAAYLAGDLELLTKVRSDGKATLEVFDLETGEIARFIDSVDSPYIAPWKKTFQEWQDVLYLKARWEKELRNRKERFSSILGKL